MEFQFKKKWGQNFLSDTNLLRAIVSDAGVCENDTVLEIGAGAGALTRALAEKAEKVVSYEIDETLKPILADNLNGFGNVKLVFSDFQKINLKELETELGDYLVVANLPYYITTPLIMRFAEETERCKSITVMVQEEVALRLAAKENTPEYGAVTAALRRRGEVKILRRIPARAFIPRPKVDSAVVKADFTQGGFAVKDEKLYRETVRCAFSGRRKTLENNLVNYFRLTRETAKELISALNVDENVRGEALSPETLGKLSDFLAEKKIGLQ